MCLLEFQYLCTYKYNYISHNTMYPTVEAAGKLSESNLQFNTHN